MIKESSLFQSCIIFFQLLQSGSSEYHVILGAKCLQITSEEFISPREDVSFARKTELKNFLTSRVLPDIFTLLLRKLLLQLVLSLSYHKKSCYIYKKKLAKVKTILILFTYVPGCGILYIYKKNRHLSDLFSR